MEKTLQFNQEKTYLGIELGSTRIKAVLIDESYRVVAQGDYGWENKHVAGVWTYDEEEVWTGIQVAYKNLKEAVKQQYGVTLTKVGSMGFSAMMHGYIALDKNEEMLVPFRTWRNNMQKEASGKLTELFQYNIPERWSIAHLYQAILNNESHVKDMRHLFTLAGYVHYKLTGEKVIGVGEASGMFPIDLESKYYSKVYLDRFEEAIRDTGFTWKLADLLPDVKVAGEVAGHLTKEGALQIDPSGELEAGIPFAPAEGDAGTGMVATNSVRKRTGNVSAGTSIFAMVVLEKELSKVHPQIDLVTTPSGYLVGMAHANNCTSDLNQWVALFKEYTDALGMPVDTDQLYETLYMKALEGDEETGGLLSFGYLSGEHMTGFESGRPLFVRETNSEFNLANFMRTHLYSAMSAMKIGMDQLFKEENVKLDEMLGHGGIFKTKGVAQQFMADALKTPVSIMETAGEGGAYGMAVLAAYIKQSHKSTSLESFLTDDVYGDAEKETLHPTETGSAGFDKYIERYKKGLAIERAAVDQLK